MLIANGTVVTLDTVNSIYTPGWVRVDDGVITQVSAQRLDAGPGEEVIDGSGQIILPGLINSHTHLFQTLIRGIYEELPFDDWLRMIYHCGVVLSASDAEVSARLGAIEALRHGATTVVEHHFLNGRPEIPDATIAGMRAVGIRAAFARTSMDLGSLAPPEVLETPAAAVNAAAALLDHYRGEHDARRVTILAGANTPGVSASGDMAIAMTEFALATGIRQSMHIAESRAVLDRLAGASGIWGVVRWLDGLNALQGPALAAHSVHIDQEEIELLAARGIAIVHNPISNLFLGDGIAPVWEAIRAGVTVALGTDGPSSNNSQSMFEVVKIAGLLQRGHRADPTAVGPLTALRMATTNAARALGLDDIIGSIEVGKRADLIMVDALRTPGMVALHNVVSQLVHCAPSLTVTRALVDGETVFHGGHATRVDEEAVLAEGQAAGLQLAARLIA